MATDRLLNKSTNVRSLPVRALGAALGLITGGAVGNLADRLRSPRGVVDFIDMGLGDYRFWTFNVADVGVTVGAALLLYILLRRSRQEEPDPI